MPTSRVASVALALFASVSSSCKESTKPPPPTPSARASASASVAQRPEPLDKKQAPPCRAMGVKGDVRTPKRPIVEREPLTGEQWIELGPDSKLDVKHAASGREYSLFGPGLALPCREGRERIVLAHGEIRTSVGVGARPGALVLIATPFGVIRYGEASLGVKVESGKAKVSVDTGAAWLAAAEGARVAGKERLIGPKAEARLQFTATDPDPERLVTACEKQAQAAKQQAKDLLTRSRAPKLGERAKEHMQQRSQAREACLVAEAASRLAQEPTRAAALLERVNAANRSWSELPGPPTLQQK